jgi:hypothetical protein
MGAAIATLGPQDGVAVFILILAALALVAVLIPEIRRA